MEQFITKEYLKDNPNHVFVFGDNLIRGGLGGAAKLRNEPNTYGFITKRYPDNRSNSFYHPDTYQTVFREELINLIKEICGNPDKTYLISKLGAGLANRNNIWELVIRDGLESLRHYSNVKFLYGDDCEKI